jgi:hypothetical protein
VWIWEGEERVKANVSTTFVGGVRRGIDGEYKGGIGDVLGFRGCLLF